MGFLILIMPISGLHIDLDQLESKATPKFMLVATLESSLFLDGRMEEQIGQVCISCRMVFVTLC